MKSTAAIFALLIGFLILQPGLNVVRSNTNLPECVKKEEPPSCSKRSCDKPAEEDEDCESKCNPLMGCPTGNFYVHHYTTITITSLIAAKEKNIVLNDNRILQQSSECWHPPEVYS